MAQSIEEFRQQIRDRLRMVADAVQEALPEIATLITISAKAMAERNIKEKGVGTYSTNPIPVYWFEGKDLNAAGREWLKERQGETPTKKRRKGSERQNTRSDGLGTWGEFRGVQGLQNNHVDLSYSNKMFANMGPGKAETGSGGVVTVPLAATNKEAQDKMNWNRERYGDFISKSLTDDNKLTLNEIAGTEVLRVLENLPTP